MQGITVFSKQMRKFVADNTKRFSREMTIEVAGNLSQLPLIIVFGASNNTVLHFLLINDHNNKNSLTGQRQKLYSSQPDLIMTWQQHNSGKLGCLRNQCRCRR